MTKHTPGPWSTELGAVFICEIGNSGLPGTAVWSTVEVADGESFPHATPQEDAAFIAAAPETAAERDHLRALNAELVEALQNNLALVELKFGNTDESANAAIAQARAILEKYK